MSNFDETMLKRLNSLEREVERLKVKESGGTWASWTPDETGWTDLPTGVYRYCKVGKMVTCMVSMSAGTSNTADAELSLPFTAATITGAIWSGATGTCYDNGSALATPCRWAFASGSTIVAFHNGWNTADGWTTSGTKRIHATFTYEAA